jgi:hypothetical protein
MIVSTAFSAAATATAGLSVTLSIAHATSVYLLASAVVSESQASSSLPLHFSWNGTPSLFVSWRWIGLYPALVLIEAGSLLSTLKEAKTLSSAPDAKNRSRARRWDVGILMVALGATLVVQVFAGQVVFHHQRSMPSWLPKAIVAVMVPPAVIAKIAV